MELGQQHKDIIELKKKLNEVVDVEEKNISKAVDGIVEKIGNLFGLTKGKKIQKRLTTKQSKMLEIIHLDEKLKPQERKILEYLIMKKYNYMKDEFIPAYFNEIKRNAHITQSTITGRLKSLTEKGLLETKRIKNKVYYYISPKFFTKEAHNVEISIEHLA
jgi:DNA-binding MarR family transcriptional regulator